MNPILLALLASAFAQSTGQVAGAAPSASLPTPSQPTASSSAQASDAVFSNPPRIKPAAPTDTTMASPNNPIKNNTDQAQGFPWVKFGIGVGSVVGFIVLLGFGSWAYNRFKGEDRNSKLEIPPEEPKPAVAQVNAQETYYQQPQYAPMQQQQQYGNQYNSQYSNQDYIQHSQPTQNQHSQNQQYAYPQLHATPNSNANLQYARSQASYSSHGNDTTAHSHYSAPSRC